MPPSETPSCFTPTPSPPELRGPSISGGRPAGFHIRSRPLLLLPEALALHLLGQASPALLPFWLPNLVLKKKNVLKYSWFHNMVLISTAE